MEEKVSIAKTELRTQQHWEQFLSFWFPLFILNTHLLVYILRMDSFPLHKYWNVGASCSPPYRLWVWCTLIYLSPVFRMRSKSLYLLIWGLTLPSILPFPSFSPFTLLPSLECTLWPPPLLLFQYFWNHKNPSAMSHFSKANLILSRQPMCCTSGNDGCCSACEKNPLAEQNLSTNYFASISNGNRLFCVCAIDGWDPMSQGRGINNGCNLLLRKHI